MKAQPPHPRTCTGEKKGETEDKTVKISPSIGPVMRLGCSTVLFKVEIAGWFLWVVREALKKWWGKAPG